MLPVNSRFGGVLDRLAHKHFAARLKNGSYEDKRKYAVLGHAGIRPSGIFWKR